LIIVGCVLELITFQSCDPAAHSVCVFADLISDTKNAAARKCGLSSKSFFG